MEPSLSPIQFMAVFATVPLAIFVVVNALDKVRDPAVRWGRTKSGVYLTLISCGTSASGVIAYSLAKLPATVTPLLAYAISASVLSTYLYACKTLTVTMSVAIAARKRAADRRQSQA